MMEIMIYYSELIGIIGETIIHSALFKFELINKSGIVIQFLIWNKEVIEKFSKILLTGNVCT